ncbi:hypothetical protein NHX12_012710 [Muraenolepis orangiensis]|uniref:Uncharacterized protein n=1 Tax=Muraenolepis orangiensis TaxID=630683 RepID=A0A9Q0DFZ0_9TELE|nr:hypothetical protein NHX12_012710 [Muraenolepis orangiensis]
MFPSQSLASRNTQSADDVTSCGMYQSAALWHAAHVPQELIRIQFSVHTVNQELIRHSVHSVNQELNQDSDSDFTL